MNRLAFEVERSFPSQGWYIVNRKDTPRFSVNSNDADYIMYGPRAMQTDVRKEFDKYHAVDRLSLSVEYWNGEKWDAPGWGRIDYERTSSWRQAFEPEERFEPTDFVWVDGSALWKVIDKASHLPGHIPRVQNATLAEQILHESGYDFSDRDYYQEWVNFWSKTLQMYEEVIDELKPLFDKTGVPLRILRDRSESLSLDESAPWVTIPPTTTASWKQAFEPEEGIEEESPYHGYRVDPEQLRKFYEYVQAHPKALYYSESIPELWQKLFRQTLSRTQASDVADFFANMVGRLNSQKDWVGNWSDDMRDVRELARDMRSFGIHAKAEDSSPYQYHLVLKVQRSDLDAAIKFLKNRGGSTDLYIAEGMEEYLPGGGA